jgi:hypothetical protein
VAGDAPEREIQLKQKAKIMSQLIKKIFFQTKPLRK